MTFDEFIQDGLSKADKLFDKLAQSGPNAVKTRERLFADLKAELSHLSRFERHHLIPALGDHKKTQPLVKALDQDREKVANLLSELETAPRAGDAFLLKLTELQGAFQAHVRNERKELLPAVLDALHRAQKAEQGAAAELEAAELKAAELKAAEAEAAERKAAELKAAEAEAAERKAAELKASEAEAAERKAAELKAVKAATEAKVKAAVAEPAPPAQAASEPEEPPRVPLPVPAPLAAIAILQTIAPPLAPAPAPLAVELPKALSLPLPTPVYGVQAWSNLMQEAAAGAMMGYRLMMAYSNNTGFATLQTRLMKEQLELMTKSGAKMMEAAQRFTKTPT
jgi:flagellar biosynthesis GTPase FlhF